MIWGAYFCSLSYINPISAMCCSFYGVIWQGTKSCGRICHWRYVGQLSIYGYWVKMPPVHQTGRGCDRHLSVLSTLVILLAVSSCSGPGCSFSTQRGCCSSASTTKHLNCNTCFLCFRFSKSAWNWVSCEFLVKRC